MNKTDAIQKVNSLALSERLTNANTHYSNINKSKNVWWLNISPEKFKTKFYILLKSQNHLILLEILANSFTNLKKVFRYRTDKDLIDLEISSDKSNCYMQDIKSGGTKHHFHQYIKHKFLVTNKAS